MKKILHNEWQIILASEFEKDYYQKLRHFLTSEYKTKTIYPNMYDIFNALNYTDYKDVKVVILGQDPYHGPNQAHGLSFSVQKGVPIPPSLRNIYKELESDLGVKPVHHGHLNQWAEQGVLLLNTVLTVRKGQAYSHRKKGWERLTDAVIHSLNEREDPVIFILWGNASIAKKALINTDKHIVLTAPHPSPLSARRGFFGSKPFSKTNDALKQLGKEPINWQLTE